MVTKDLRYPKITSLETLISSSVIFNSKLTSLGRARDRWCIIIPRSSLRLLEKGKVMQVIIRPVGSLI